MIRRLVALVFWALLVAVCFACVMIFDEPRSLDVLRRLDDLSSGGLRPHAARAVQRGDPEVQSR